MRTRAAPTSFSTTTRGACVPATCMRARGDVRPVAAAAFLAGVALLFWAEVSHAAPANHVKTVKVEEAADFTVLVTIDGETAPTFQIFRLPGDPAFAVELPGVDLKNAVLESPGDAVLLTGARLDPKPRGGGPGRVVLQFSADVDYDAATKKRALEVTFSHLGDTGALVARRDSLIAARARATPGAKARAEEEERRAAALAAQQAEAVRTAALQQAAEQRLAAERAAKLDAERVALEAARTEAARVAEQQRIENELRVAAAAKAAEDAARVAAAKQAVEAKRLAEQQRIDEVKRAAAQRAEEAKRAAAQQRLAEEQRLAAAKAEEVRRVAAALAEQRRVAEEQRLAAVKADEARAAQRLADQQRAVEAQRVAAAQAEAAKRAAEQKRIDEERVAAEQRKEQAKRAAEQQRVADQQRLEQQRVAEQQRKDEEARVAARAVEQQRKDDAMRAASAAARTAGAGTQLASVQAGVSPRASHGIGFGGGSVDIGPPNRYQRAADVVVDESEFGGGDDEDEEPGRSALAHVTVERRGATRSRVGVLVDGGARYSIAKRGKDKLVLTLFDTRAGNLDVRRILDARALDGEVLRILPHVEEDARHRVQLVIELKAPAAVKMSQQDGMLWLDVGDTATGGA